MAATTKVKDVVRRISVLMQDTSPQYQRWPEHEIINWLNDGQVAIAKFLPLACSRVDAIKLVAGTRQSIATIAAADCKPGDGSTPTQPIYGKQLLNPRRNMGADGLTPGAAIRVVERDVLDSQDPDWHTRTGSTIRSLVFDPQTPRYFYVSPGVTGNVWMELAYTADPIAIPAGGVPGAELYLFAGASTTTISVDDEFVDDLVNYVVARANMAEKKWADKGAADKHAALFLGSLNAKVAAVMGANPNLTTLPGVSQ